MLSFNNVTFRYHEGDHTVLRDITFTLEAGSYHFLSGHSGSGKTSLMNLMHLTTMPSSGEITMFGRSIHALKREELFPLRKKIGMIFQDFRLLNNLPAFDNVALPLRILGRPEQEIKSHVNELLDWVGLENAKDKLPETLSGGQQQRIAIARAIIAQPKLLLADEPTGNLDDEIGYRLMGLFEQLNKMGTTIVIATHNQQIIEQFGHPCLTLSSGTLHQEQRDETGIARKIRNVY